MPEKDMKPCPFCGSASTRVQHKDIGYIGQNGYGAKLIKYQSYVMCNKCYSKGEPTTIKYIIGIEQSRNDLKENDNKAIELWNRRIS
jgi:Lar family restriction alleviation protein